MQRGFVVLVFWLFGATSPAFGGSAGNLDALDSPTRAVVAAIYSHYGDNGRMGIWPTDPELRPLFTEGLMSLLDADDELARREGIGRLDFDPFVGGHDFALSELTITLADERPDQASVEAAFANFGDPTRIIYTLVRRNDRWLIDEIAAPSGPYPWRLSDLLQAPR